jgi:hypothetical protein
MVKGQSEGNANCLDVIVTCHVHVLNCQPVPHKNVQLLYINRNVGDARQGVLGEVRTAWLSSQLSWPLGPRPHPLLC